MTDNRTQLTRDDLQGMSPAQILEANRQGLCADLGGPAHHQPPADGPWTREDVAALYREGRAAEILAAQKAGHLTDLTNPTA